MGVIAKDFGIKEALIKLGVKDLNDGTSTSAHHALSRLVTDDMEFQ